jgi:ATP-dependent Clp protease ATP-binding subunit ClpC
MFERFTERARKVVVLAQDEARHFNHNYIGTEHLLLGLLREDEGVAAQALSSLNVALDEVREQVESIVGYGEEGTGAQAPFTPRSKKVLELALREALQLGHNYIGTEHILLGLVRESEGVAARVLSNLDVDPDKVRRKIVRMLGGDRNKSMPTSRRWRETSRRKVRNRGQQPQAERNKETNSGSEEKDHQPNGGPVSVWVPLSVSVISLITAYLQLSETTLTLAIEVLKNV